MIKSICPQVVSKMVLHLHAQQQIFPALIRGSSIRHCSSDIKKSYDSKQNTFPNRMRKTYIEIRWGLFKSEAYLLLPILISSKLSFSKDKQENENDSAIRIICLHLFLYVCLFYGVSKVPPLLPLSPLQTYFCFMKILLINI